MYYLHYGHEDIFVRAFFSLPQRVMSMCPFYLLGSTLGFAMPISKWSETRMQL